MCVTSATTILAFISNLSSPFIGIRTFGVFSALLVFVNYCAVVTFFPCAVLVYDSVFQYKQYVWTPVLQKYLTKWKKNPSSEEKKTSSSLADEEDALPKFFRTTYASYLTKYRFVIIAAFGALWVIFLAFAAMLEVAPFIEFELLPEDSNFHQYTRISQEWFPKSESPKYVHVLFGLDHRDPLSLNGVAAFRFVEGESGDPQFDESFDIDSPAAQVQLVRTRA